MKFTGFLAAAALASVSAQAPPMMAKSAQAPPMMAKGASNVTYPSGVLMTTKELEAGLSNWDSVWAEHLLLQEAQNVTVPNGCNKDLTRRYLACKQQCGGWCWAATVAGMLSFHGKSGGGCSNQCTLVGEEFGASCCPSNCAQCGKDSAPLGKIADALSKHGVSLRRSSGPMSQAQLDNTLMSGRPILEIVHWNTGGSHMVVIGACANGYYSIHDPESNSWRKYTYDKVVSYNADEGKWVSSFF